MSAMAKCYLSKRQNHMAITNSSVFAKNQYFPGKNVTGMDIEAVVLQAYFQLFTTCLSLRILSKILHAGVCIS